MSLLGNFRKIDAYFETDMKANIEESVAKACQIFVYLNHKWIKLMSLSSPAGEVLANSGGLFNKRRKSSTNALPDNGEENECGESNHINILQKERGSIKRSEESNSSRSGLSMIKNNARISKRISADTDANRQSLKSESSGSSILKFSFGDTKKKRRDELMAMLKETILVCMRLPINKDNLAKVFRDKVYDIMGDLLQHFESTGELKKMIEGYKLDADENSLLTDKMVQAFFSYLNI